MARGYWFVESSEQSHRDANFGATHAKFSRRLTLALLIAAIAAVALNGPAGLVLQFVVGKFAYSTSNGAALFTLVMALLAVMHTSLRQPSALATQRGEDLLQGALWLGLLVHAGAVLSYQNRYELPWGIHHLHWKDGVNSFTSPFHSHLGKAAIDLLLSPIHSGAIARIYDTGHVFRSVMGDEFASVLAACTLVGCCALVFIAPGLASRFRGYPLLVGLYFVCGSVAIKGMLDGGILAQPVLWACFMVSVLAESNNLTGLRSRLRKRGRLVAALVAVGIAPQFLHSGTLNIPNLTTLATAIAASLLILGISLGWRVSVVASLGTYLAIVAIIDANSALLPLLSLPEPDAKVLRVDSATPLQFDRGGSSLMEIYRAHADSPQKPAWIVVGRLDTKGDRELGFLIHPETIKNELGEMIPEKAWKSVGIKPLPQAPGWFLLHGILREGFPPAYAKSMPSVVANNNTYVYKHSMARMLTKAGFTEFLMIPITAGNPIPARFFGGP